MLGIGLPETGEADAHFRLSPGLLSGAVALFVLLAASAGAGVVAANLALGGFGREDR
jgi:hypothetical protein